MRTLKKTLCLVLAVVLCFGLVGTAFAGNFDDFTDADKVSAEYKEAMDVFIGLKIVEGDAKLLDPAGSYTRAAAAKIMALTVGGPSVENLNVSTNAYKDVTADYWAMKYIAYCQSMGLMEGYGDGNFGPNDAITGQQMAVLCLRSVGYGANKEYSAADWALVGSRDALKLGIFDDALIADGANSSKALTREQAIQMAFITMTKVECMEYRDLLKSYVQVGSGSLGQTVNPTFLKANYKMTSVPDENGFGYNGHNWYSGIKMISAFYVDDVIIDTPAGITGMTCDALYKAYSWDDVVTAIVNGEADSTTYAPKTQLKGVADKVGAALPKLLGCDVSLVDTDSNGKIDEINVVRTFLGKVTGVTAATTIAKRTVAMTIYNAATAGGDATDVIVENDTLAKGDFVAVVPAKNGYVTTGSTIAPLSVAKLTAVTSTVEKYNASTVTFNGTAAPYAYVGEFPVDGSAVSFAFSGTTYDFYVGANGFVLGAFLNTGSALNYAYVLQAQMKGTNDSLFGSATGLVKAQLVYADGKVETLDYKVQTATAAFGIDANNAKVAAGTGGATAVAVGGFYYTVEQTDGTLKYYVPAGTAQAAAGISAGAYSYTKNADGTVSLSLITFKQLSGVTSGIGTVSNLATAKGSAITNISGKFATSATKLTVLDATGKVLTTYTGIANFPTKTFTGLTAFYLYTATAVTDIVVLGGTAAEPDAVYAMFVGEPSASSAGITQQFVVAGAKAGYLMATPYAGTAGDLVKLEANSDGEYTATILANTANSIVVGATVALADTASFVVAPSTQYVMGTVKAYVVNTTAMTMVEGTVETGDTVTVVYKVVDGVNTVVALFITAKA